MSPRRRQPGAEHVTEAIRWLGWAEGDLVTAIENEANPKVPYRNAAYEAQQAAEKAIKAVILLAGLGFDEVHDLEALATQVPAGFPLPVTTDALARLSDLATEGRYPDEGEAIAADEVAQAIATATKICSAAVEHFVARGVDRASITPR